MGIPAKDATGADLTLASTATAAGELPTSASGDPATGLPFKASSEATLEAARLLLVDMLAQLPVPSAADPTAASLGIVTRAAPPLFWRVGFAEVGSGLQGLAAAELDLIKTGSGMAVNQSGGNLVITTGTTTNSETVIRSKLQFHGALLARYKAILSQRIANQTFRFELADLVGDTLAYTINSATSVTVTIPGGVFTAADVGKFLRLSALSSVGIPGRYAIASTSGDNVTFTVAGWPASGSGTLTVYGHNWMAAEYTGTTATNVSIDAQRRGWSSGNTTATINTTASPGHVGQFAFDVLTMGYSDALVASNTGYQWANRASRVENVPDEDINLYFILVVQNGSTAPASTTTLTVGFLSVEDQPRNKVRISSSDPAGSHAQPVQVMGGSLSASITGNPVLGAGANAIGTVGPMVPATPYILNSAATTNIALILTGTSGLQAFYATNTGATVAFVKLYNKATAPVLATDVPAMIIPVPAAVSGVPGIATLPVGFSGFRFALGLGIAITGAVADTDTTAVAAGQVKVMLSRTV